MFRPNTFIVDEDFTVDVIEEHESEDDHDALIIMETETNNQPKNEYRSEEIIISKCDDIESKDSTSPGSQKSPNITKAKHRKPFTNQRLTFEEFASIKRVKKSISEGSLEKPYVCPICEFKMTRSTTDAFTTHLNSHVRGERCFQCQYCGYATFSKAAFTRHKAGCNYSFKVQCPDCSFVTTKARNLRKHMRNRHSIDRSQVSGICDLKYGTQYCRKNTEGKLIRNQNVIVCHSKENSET